MTEIIICGHDNEILNAIKRSLDKYCNYEILHDNILVSAQSHFSEAVENNSVVVISNRFHGKICNGNFIAIFFSSDNHAVETLNGSGNIAISCGTSPKDTISAASIDDGKHLVSLQRTIRSIRNKIVEPRDFYVRSDCALYPSLAACAVLLLLGIIPEEGFEF